MHGLPKIALILKTHKNLLAGRQR